MASAVSTWDGTLPDAEILEEPDEFRRWYTDWAERRRSGEPQQKWTHTWKVN